METKDDPKIDRQSELSSSFQEISDEVNLFNDIQDSQIIMKEEKKSELEIRVEEEKSIEILIGNDCDSDDDELICNNEMFINIINKIKIFLNQSKKEKLEKNLLINESNIFKEFFILIDKYQTNLTDEHLLEIKKAFKSFIDTTHRINPKNILLNDFIHSKELFYIYFNLLNISIIQNYLKNFQIDEDFLILYRLSISRILIVMIDTCTSTNFTLKDFKKPINSNELLFLMLNYVRTNLKTSNLTLYPTPTDPSITRELILTFIWSYSDKTVFVEDLIEIGTVEIMIKALTIILKTLNVNIIIKQQIISIIYNISRHHNGIKHLNNLNGLDIIKEFQNKNDDIHFYTKSTMIIALLSTPEQIRNNHQRMNPILDTLLQMVYDTSISSNYRYQSTLYHLSELLIVFVKLFNDDFIIDYIMLNSKVNLYTSSIIEFFINLLINYYKSQFNQDDPFKQTTFTAIINILWSISFQDKYKDIIRNSNQLFKDIIIHFTKQIDENISFNEYVPQYIENIEKASKGILFNIDQLNDLTNKNLNNTIDISNNQKKPMVMISYSHEDMDFCMKLYNEIHQYNYDIWVDFDFLKTGDLWESICHGMKQANAIICLISDDYCKSKSCRLEATYAFDKLHQTKPIIPVFLKYHELPEWLDIRIIMFKYVRFTNLTQLENDKFIELIDMIQHSLSTNTSNQHSNLHSPILSTDDQEISTLITKENKSTLQIEKNSPIHNDQSVNIKSIEKQNITLNITPLIASTIMINQNLSEKKFIEEWNKNDIAQWFEQNKIRCEFRDLCDFQDGQELLNYAKIFLDTEKNQYEIYCEEFLKRNGITFGKKPLLLHQFTKFSNALRKLEKINASQ